MHTRRIYQVCDVQPCKVSIAFSGFLVLAGGSGRARGCLVRPHVPIPHDFLTIDSIHSYRCLGIEAKKGTLRAGADADFVVLDKNGYVVSTWVRGQKVYTK